MAANQMLISNRRRHYSIRDNYNFLINILNELEYYISYVRALACIVVPVPAVHILCHINNMDVVHTPNRDGNNNT